MRLNQPKKETVRPKNNLPPLRLVEERTKRASRNPRRNSTNQLARFRDGRYAPSSTSRRGKGTRLRDGPPGLLSQPREGNSKHRDRRYASSSTSRGRGAGRAVFADAAMLGNDSRSGRGCPSHGLRRLWPCHRPEPRLPESARRPRRCPRSAVGWRAGIRSRLD